MFFIKKLISFFISPLVIVFILGALALFYFYRRKEKQAKIFLALLLSWLFIISYHPISSSMLMHLESHYSKLEVFDEKITHVLALGGDTKGRSYELLRLFHLNKHLKIITSGYEPNGSDGAKQMATLLREFGIPREAIIIKSQSRDTKEEALMMQRLVGKNPFILVTAAYHMPRAMALFKKLGLNPIAAPTNFLAKKSEWSHFLSLQSLTDFDKALHEYVGLLWYKIRGDI